MNTETTSDSHSEVEYCRILMDVLTFPEVATQKSLL